MTIVDGLMFKLILSTIGLSATDCLDPLAMSVVIFLLTTKRPVLNSGAYLLGILLTTWTAGLILSFGVIQEVDSLLSHPHAPYFAFQLFIGAAIAFGGWSYWHHAHRETTCEVPIKIVVNPIMALVIGIVFTATDLPTNVPLIAVAEALVKNQASPPTTILSCLAYSMVRIAPPAALLLIYLLKQEKSAAIIDRIQAPMMKWGHRVTAVIILLLGLVLAADSIYFFTTGSALLVV